MEYYKNNRFSKIAELNYKIAILLKCRELYNKITHEDYFLEDLPKALKLVLPVDESNNFLFGQPSKEELNYFCNMIAWFFPEKLVEIKILDFQCLPEVPLISLPENLMLTENFSIIK